MDPRGGGSGSMSVSVAGSTTAPLKWSWAGESGGFCLGSRGESARSSSSQWWAGVVDVVDAGPCMAAAREECVPEASALRTSSACDGSEGTLWFCIKERNQSE